MVGAQRRRTSLLRAAQRAMPVVAALVAIATLGLVVALIQGDLTVRHVAEQTTRNLPPLYRVAALWSGDMGRRLVFALLVASCAIVAARGQSGVGSRSHWTMPALALVVAVAIAWAALGTPLATLPWQPLEGRGMLPQLRTPVAALVTPATLLAHAILLVTLPLALDSGRLARITPWLLGAWFMSGTAIALGVVAAEGNVTGNALMRAAGPATLAMWWVATLLLVLPPARGWWWPASITLRRSIVGAALVGAALIACGVVGRLNPVVHTPTLSQGETIRVADAFDYNWSVAQQGMSIFRNGDAEVTAVTLEARRVDGGASMLLVPEWRQFVDSSGDEVFGPLALPAIARGVAQDIVVTMESAMPNAAGLRVEFRPLASWLWIGCVLLLAAGAAAWLSSLRRAA